MKFLFSSICETSLVGTRDLCDAAMGSGTKKLNVLALFLAQLTAVSYLFLAWLLGLVLCFFACLVFVCILSVLLGSLAFLENRRALRDRADEFG